MIDGHPLDDYEELARPLDEVSAVVSRIKGNGLRFDYRGEEISMVHLKILASHQEPNQFFILGIDDGGDSYVLDLGDRHGQEEWVKVSESSQTASGVDQGVAEV